MVLGFDDALATLHVGRVAADRRIPHRGQGQPPGIGSSDWAGRSGRRCGGHDNAQCRRHGAAACGTLDGMDTTGAGVGADGSRALDGRMSLRDLEELLGIDLDESELALGPTLGELVAARLAGPPAVGARTPLAGHLAQVERVEPDTGRVARVRLLPFHGGRAP